MNQYDDDDEQLNDELIGEAVLSLLQEKGPISLKSLRSRLVSMQSNASGQRQHMALDKIISELDSTVQGRMPQSQQQATGRDKKEPRQPLAVTTKSATSGKLH